MGAEPGASSFPHQGLHLQRLGEALDYFTFSSYLLKMSDRVGELAQWETENPTEFESSIVIKKARSG